MIRGNHFDANKNITLGGRRAKASKILPELLGQPLDSAASAGGGATETIAVSGLTFKDEILGAFLKTPGGTATSALVSAVHGTAEGTIDCSFTADPGAGAVVRLIVRRSIN
jgi:hypothetical protein